MVDGQGKRPRRGDVVIFLITLFTGPGALLVWPLPPPLGVGCAVIGACAGGLALLEDEALVWLGAGVFVLGLSAVQIFGNNRWPQLEIHLWQTGSIALFATAAVIVVVPTLGRAYQKRGRIDRRGREC